MKSVRHHAAAAVATMALVVSAPASAQTAQKWDFGAAWRYIDYEMKSGRAVEDINFNGPGLAAVFRW
jgi:hypothetical protein